MESKLKIYLFLIAGLALVAGSPFFGAEWLNLSQVVTPATPDHRIFFELRLPRLLFLLMVGGSLAVLGCLYQILFLNPLAEPYLLGVSSAVTLGIALGEVFGHFAPFALSGMAIGGICAFTTTLLLLGLYLSENKRGRGLEKIVLFGMALNFVFSSAVFLLLSYVNQQMGGGSLRWIFGQVPWLSLREVAWFATGIIPLLVVELIYARHLDAIAMGDAVARTLGFSPKTVRPILLIVSSIHISLIVSISGAIGFVGLIVPHAVRLFFHPSSTRTLQLLSFVLGAVFLILSDTLSRKLLPPFEFPIGIITTLFGGPLFLLLLWRRKN